MNPWLLSAAALLGLIGIVHSVMGEQRIFRPWALQPPPGVRPFHRQILRGSWHLPSLGSGMLACGALVLWMTKGRHPGGTALVAAALLVFGGLVQAGAR